MSPSLNLTKKTTKVTPLIQSNFSPSETPVLQATVQKIINKNNQSSVSFSLDIGMIDEENKKTFTPMFFGKPITISNATINNIIMDIITDRFRNYIAINIIKLNEISGNLGKENFQKLINTLSLKQRQSSKKE